MRHSATYGVFLDSVIGFIYPEQSHPEICTTFGLPHVLVYTAVFFCGRPNSGKVLRSSVCLVGIKHKTSCGCVTVQPMANRHHEDTKGRWSMHGSNAIVPPVIRLGSVSAHRNNPLLQRRLVLQQDQEQGEKEGITETNR